MAVYRVGVVGCGGIAQVHAQVLSRMENIEFVSCADIRFDRAQRMAEKYRLHAYNSLEAMLNGEKLDCIHLCTPHYLHTPMVLSAAEKGIAVFTEKPPVISREQWQQLMEAAKRIPVGVCFQNRFNANVQALRQIVASGEMGELIGARAFVTWQRDASYYVDSGWRGAWATEGGGVLMNQAVHTLDLLIHVMGHADEVQGSMANHHLSGVIEVEDTLEARLRIGGKTALLYATTAYAADAPVLTDFHFTGGVVRLENDDYEIIRGREHTHFSCFMPEKMGKGYWGAGHPACIGEFYRCLETGETFLNAVENVADTADALLKLYGR